MYQKRPINVPKETYRFTKRDPWKYQKRLIHVRHTHQQSGQRDVPKETYKLPKETYKLPKETYKCIKGDVHMSEKRTSKAVSAMYQKRLVNVPKKTYKCTKRDLYMSDTRTSKAVSAFRGSLHVYRCYQKRPINYQKRPINVPKETYICQKNAPAKRSARFEVAWMSTILSDLWIYINIHVVYIYKYTFVIYIDIHVVYIYTYRCV